MAVCIVTGSAGLIGSESVRFFADQGLDVVGIDNNMRETFFGKEAGTDWNRKVLESSVPRYHHHSIDIRDEGALEALFSHYGRDIEIVIHTAAQPSHDWAAKDPQTDFTVNANGTLALLEATRKSCPDASFILTSTNKVYGDLPNSLPLIEHDSRWEISEDHPFFEHGIDENFSVDQSKHSLFGVSKLAADMLVQEYGRYFGMNTVCFRGGCLTGPSHSGTQLHGFLSYLVKCAITGQPYTIFGYKGKQVRDNIHAYDLVNMFWHYYQSPVSGEVFNAGGGRHSNCSVLEAIRIIEELTGKHVHWSLSDENRIGDHIWYISDTRKFQKQYPDWSYKYNVRQIIAEIVETATAKVG